MGTWSNFFTPRRKKLSYPSVRWQVKTLRTLPSHLECIPAQSQRGGFSAPLLRMGGDGHKWGASPHLRPHGNINHQADQANPTQHLLLHKHRSPGWAVGRKP